MRPIAFALMVAALYAGGAAAPARAQSDEEKQQLRAELVKQLDARMRKFRAEMVEEIDRALGLKPADRPAKPERPARPDRPAKPDRSDKAPGFLGVAVRELTKAMRELLAVPGDTGVLVDEVVAGSAAQAAGLRRTDVIVSWNDAKIASEADLAKQAGASHAGAVIKLGLVRDGKPLAVEVKLLAQGESAPATEKPAAGAGDMQKMLEDAMRGKLPSDPAELQKMLEGFQGNPEMQEMLQGAMKQFEEMMKDPASRQQIEEMMKQFLGQGSDAEEMQKRLQDMLKPGGDQPKKDPPKKDDVERMLDDLLGEKKPGTAKPEPAPAPKAGPAYLGVSIQPLDEATRTQLGLAAGEGLAIAGVVEGSPAAAAGLVAQDIVVSLDGAVVGDPAALQKAVASKVAGDKVSVGVLRKGERKTIEVTLGERPSDQSWK